METVLLVLIPVGAFTFIGVYILKTLRAVTESLQANMKDVLTTYEKNTQEAFQSSTKIADTLDSIVKRTQDKDYKVVELLLDGTFAKNLEQFAEIRRERAEMEHMLADRAATPEPVVQSFPHTSPNVEVRLSPEEEREKMEDELLR